MTDGVLARVRQPEYTGENRCVPCTLANTAIAVVLAVGVGYGWLSLGGGGLAVASLVAVAVLVVSGLSIWLRGYLVPGTPELTKRYLPERVLRLVGQVREPSPPGVIDAESYLLSADVLIERPDGSDLAFAPWFESAWRTHLAAMRDAAAVDVTGDSDTVVAADDTAESDGDTAPAADVAALAGLTGIDEASLALHWWGDAGFARAEGERIGHWESRAAFLADVAADRALGDRLDGWGALPLASRSGVLGALRLFVENCPACEGVVEIEERVIESCCTRYDVVAGRCAACNARLFEMDLPASATTEADADAEVD